jgi:hypothetical protein
MQIKHTDGGREQAGFQNEWNDCSVRALAIAAGITYGQAHDLLKAQGRKDRKGARVYMIRAAAASTAKVEDVLVRQPKTHWMGGYSYTCPTLSQVIRKHSSGRYILITRNHAIALVDGVIYDSFEPGAKTRIRCAIKLTVAAPKSEVLPEVKPELSQADINAMWERLNKLKF